MHVFWHRYTDVGSLRGPCIATRFCAVWVSRTNFSRKGNAKEVTRLDGIGECGHILVNYCGVFC